MDRDSFVYSLNPIKCLIDALKHVSMGLDLSEEDAPRELYPEDNKKVKGTIKVESAPEIELDEVVSIKSKPYVIEKPSNILETIQKKRTIT